MITKLHNDDITTISGGKCMCNLADGRQNDTTVESPYGCRIYCCELILLHYASIGWTWIDEAGRSTSDRC